MYSTLESRYIPVPLMGSKFNYLGENGHMHKTACHGEAIPGGGRQVGSELFQDVWLGGLDFTICKARSHSCLSKSTPQSIFANQRVF